MSIDRWKDEEDVVYVHNGMLLCYEKEQNFAISSNMDELGMHYAKVK